jgi:hypothetical protein
MTLSQPHVVWRLKLTESFVSSQEVNRSIRESSVAFTTGVSVAFDRVSVGLPIRRFAYHPFQLASQQLCTDPGKRSSVGAYLSDPASPAELSPVIELQHQSS